MLLAPSPTRVKVWQCERWSAYAASLVRYYSRRGDFAVKLTTTVPTAAVDPRAKRVYLNPELEALEPGLERHNRVRVSSHARLVTLFKGYAAHEAGHIRFSFAKPRGLLGQLWNSLEDERLERLQQRDYPETGNAFTFLGDHFLARASVREDVRTALNGVLLWRWQHDHPEKLWWTDEGVWDEVRPLVEEAWQAEDSEDVTAIAREILRLLGLPEDAPEDPDLAELGLSPFSGQRAEGAGDDSRGSLGKGGGEPAPEEPDDPEDSLERSYLLGAEVEGLARNLAASLAQPKPRATSLERSRGRLRVERVIQGQSRPFERREETQVKPRRLFVVQDVSGSMGDPDDAASAQHHAVRAALALNRACEMLNIPMCLIAYDHQGSVIRPFEMPPVEAKLAIASVAGGGFTNLASGLRLVAPLARPEMNDLVIVLCDGALDEQDVQASRRLAQGIPAVFIPLLLGKGEEEAQRQFERVFGSYFPVEDHRELAQQVRRAINLLR